MQLKRAGLDLDELELCTPEMLRELLEPTLLPLLRFATRSYIPGPKVENAIALADAAQNDGLLATIGYWNDGKESPEAVADIWRRALDAIAAAHPSSFVSLKIPALHDRLDLAAEIVERARAANLFVMLDSHAPEQQDANFALIDRVGARLIGVATPGRWRRSAKDLERAAALGVRVRIVKGQWADPDDPNGDLREGFLDTVDRAAGLGLFVGVATHDAPLAAEAMRRLSNKGSQFEQELVFPLPFAAARAAAAPFIVPSRLYIPFGEAWLPYSVSRVARDPRILFWLARDLIANHNAHYLGRASSARRSAP
ncbi:MAG: hypothetical protein K2Q06_02240, partial [Parvularculaceae bacterium]|nr:hypothetical protein [Parvularculaceae bacterium]